MKRHSSWLVGLLAVAAVAVPGCLGRHAGFTFPGGDDLGYYETVATEIEYPDVCEPSRCSVVEMQAPHTLAAPGPVEYWDLSLEDAIQLALANTRVLRDLGATVLRSPDSIRTPYGPSLQESDAQFGVEAALSAFDADFSTSLFFERNDRRLNNEFLGNNGFYRQDYDVFQAEITKRAASGGQFSLRKNIDYDANNSLGNRFPSAWDVNLEGEVRQPLLQGGGLLFNRIAGPGGQPGSLNGVVIARIRTDISLADFEIGVRDFISNVENAYWDLYFAYRDLDARIKARDGALETWRRIYAQWETGRVQAEKELQAREQYYAFEADVQNALTGRLVESTRTNNGSTGGTFRSPSGVQLQERRLRLMLGLPANGDQMIRPADEPPIAPVAFDWAESASEAMTRRAELRRQRWQVKRREMELIASKNFLLPNLDLVGQYRWRGFGHTLIDSDRDDRERFDNAYMDLTSGDFQEWLLGAEFSVPIGFRQAHAAVRNAELQLTRERAVLTEEERQVMHDLSNAVAEADRARVLLETSKNRSLAANGQLKAVEAAYEDNRTDFFVVLDAQRRAADSEIQYFRARVEYALAIKNVHFERGTLLDYCGVLLSEGPWPTAAYADAAELNATRGKPRPLDRVMGKAPIVSQGTYSQEAYPVFPIVTD